MHFLTLFLDGVGLGKTDPTTNPFTQAQTPNLIALLGGNRLLKSTLGEHNQPLTTDSATLLGLDASLGVDGLPQSASGQAALLTGINIPAKLGQHYGPKPNSIIKSYLERNTLFHRLCQRGYRVALLNAYPKSYFESITSGKRLPGAVAMAALNAGIALKTTDDLIAGRAVSADFTGLGWRDRLKIDNVPILSLLQAGEQIASVAYNYDFSFFEFWLSDYAGHKTDMDRAVELIESFDIVLGRLLAAWNTDQDMLLIISDHGNLEDLNTRRHTFNPVPGLIIGPSSHRQKFSRALVDLTGITPAILQFFQ